MAAPLISYITFNRLGLTVKSLSSILKSREDFELAIVDNNSRDGTWNYIQELTDKRIKYKTRLPVNLGHVYALNHNLSKRRDNQYFIAVENNVIVETPNWLTTIMRAFRVFPDIGLLCIHDNFPPPNLPQVKPRVKNEIICMEFSKEQALPSDAHDHYVPGDILCLKPDLIRKIGYFSEENYHGSMELFNRANNYTPHKTAILLNVAISIPSQVTCAECPCQNICELDTPQKTCITLYEELNSNAAFRKKFYWKYNETCKDLISGARTPYCTSQFSDDSVSSVPYNLDWAIENLQFYIEKGN
ncbi:glycosyltransferase [Dehalobacter sp. DCM]|uniref:glycosyltransferase family 2 protein n=1 Tax=Dehalobacter sp. DCM TaxID=2907827 RepID=UPI0030818935|nr:glycosyltransferase [Dehalobacter sp. DCM]